MKVELMLRLRESTAVALWAIPLRFQPRIYRTLIVLLAISLILRFLARSTDNRSRWAMTAIVVVCLDLGISGRGNIHQVSKAEVNEVVSALGQPSRTEPNRWMRTKTGSGWPTVWSQRSSDERLLEVEASSRAAWFGRWHLADRVHVLNNMVSIRSRNVAVFWQAISQLTSELEVDEQVRLWRSLRRWLAIDGSLHVSGRANVIDLQDRDLYLVDLSPRSVGPTIDLNGYQTWEYSSKRLTPAMLVERFQQAGFLVDDNGQRVPKRQTPVVQLVGDSQAQVIHDNGESGLDSEAFWRATRLKQQPESAVYQVQARTPLLITRPTIQDGNWRARFTSVEPDAVFSEFARSSWQAAQVHGVDGITQGVILPRGQWWVEFYYQPRWLPLSLVTFSIGWFATIICCIVCRKAPVATVPDAPVPAAGASC